MSNPLTNVDIEDVLSSIRRLVSEGDRTVAPRPAEAVREVASPTPGRFVLTPALRVVAPAADAGDTETVSADVAPADPAPLILTNNRNLSNLEATIAELEAAVTWQNNEFEPDGSEVAATQQRTDAPSDLRRRVVDDAEIADAENAETDSANAESADAENADAENADAEVAEIENADAPVAMPNLMFHHKTYDDTDDDHHDDLMDGDDDDAADDLTAYLDDDSTIDESALRDMVAQIVRAELQGELGERITRNVRKLVRREIYRVINSQEFE